MMAAARRALKKRRLRDERDSKAVIATFFGAELLFDGAGLVLVFVEEDGTVVLPRIVSVVVVGEIPPLLVTFEAVCDVVIVEPALAAFGLFPKPFQLLVAWLEFVAGVWILARMEKEGDCPSLSNPGVSPSD